MPRPTPAIYDRARKFLECWRTRNAAGSLTLLQLTWASKLSRSQLRKTMASRFDAQRLLEYELGTLARTMAVCDVEAVVRFEKEGRKRLYFRMVCEDGPYRPNAEGTGTWGINPTSTRIEDIKNEN
jgi:hypothetical protein